MEKPVIREHMIQTLKQMPIKQKQQKETLILVAVFFRFGKQLSQ